ncbi:hypothetical protein, partial [Salmonella enterica]|uniref:hypothetical protein n=1 Tax=Salmonella enterica TaxID=28901 RepID=UPI00403A6DB7
ADAHTRSTAPRPGEPWTGRCTAAFCGANQHNHGLLVSWALQGEGMACAPWYVRQRLRRASGRCGSCAALVFSFAPSIRLRGLKT